MFIKDCHEKGIAGIYKVNLIIPLNSKLGKPKLDMTTLHIHIINF
jgi:hypothetical protein